MNHSTQRPRFTRGAHDPAAHAYSIVGFFSQVLTLLAYLGRTLNDTMCDHTAPEICDRCQGRLFTFGAMIAESASAVAGWTPVRIAHLNARLAIAAARRLADTVELGEPMMWAMKGGAVVTAARRAFNAAAALLNEPDLGAMNEANAAARECQQLDQSTTRVARKRGLAQESMLIGCLLKASAKAAESAVAATESMWALEGSARVLERAQAAENAAGAALGAALDGASALQGTGRAESMMVIGTGVCAEFDRIARPAGDTPKAACGNSPSQEDESAPDCPAEIMIGDVRLVHAPQKHAYIYPDSATLAPAEPVWGGKYLDAAMGAALAEARVETPTEEYNVMDEFAESELGDVVDEAIGDAAAALARLEQAEKALNAIAEEHQPVEAWLRKDISGEVTEYLQKCCMSCRDAAGRPVPAPCRTIQKLNAFWDATECRT